MADKIRVIVWNEFIHEQENETIKILYPQGIHGVIAEFLGEHRDLEVSTATLNEPDHGLPQDRLNQCDVLLWWGHIAHDRVSDATVAMIQRRVLEGMGLIVLHSGHFSKIFQRLMGTNCSLKWREAEELERVWVLEPSHPIAQGLGQYFEIPVEEMYGERFDIPKPDETVFVSWFEGGEVFRSGCCWQRGHGKIFYFRPGHEAYPTYYIPEVQRVITNAVYWARPLVTITDSCPNIVKPLSPIVPKGGHFASVGVVQSGRSE